MGITKKEGNMEITNWFQIGTIFLMMPTVILSIWLLKEKIPEKIKSLYKINEKIWLEEMIRGYPELEKESLILNFYCSICGASPVRLTQEYSQGCIDKSSFEYNCSHPSGRIRNKPDLI